MPESTLTRVMQAMSGRVSWLLALGVLAFPVLAIIGMLLFAIYGNPAVPTATVVATLPNPRGTFTAVVEKVDNGMGSYAASVAAPAVTRPGRNGVVVTYNQK